MLAGSGASPASASSARPVVVICLGQKRSARRQVEDISTVTGSALPRLAPSARMRVKNSSGILMSSPRKSLTCESRIRIAMPLVKPITIDTGMKRMRLPSRSAPMRKSRKPAPIVQIARLATPYCATMPYTITM